METCPNCGYCPHCKRGGFQTLPWYPTPYPWYPSYPLYPVGPTWVATGGATSNGIPYPNNSQITFTN